MTPWFKKRREERRKRVAERVTFFTAFPPDERLLGAPIYPTAVFDPESSASVGWNMANTVYYAFQSTDSLKRVVAFYESQLKTKADCSKGVCHFFIRSNPDDPESYKSIRITEVTVSHETAIVFGGYPDPTVPPLDKGTRVDRKKSEGPLSPVVKSIAYSFVVRFIAIPLAVSLGFVAIFPLAILLDLLSLNTPNGMFVKGAFALGGLVAIVVYVKTQRFLRKTILSKEEQGKKDTTEKPQ